MISENNEDAYSLMIDKYQPLVQKCAVHYYNHYYQYGVEKDELLQEGNLGLINAIKFYNKSDKCLFYTFAIVVIKREMERHIKRNLRYKHRVLTNATSLNDTIGYGDLVIEDTLYNINDNVERIIDDKYYWQILYEFKFELSDFQSQVFELRLNNFSNREIATLLDVTYKRVDNAIRLIKQKFKSYIQIKI